MVRRGDCAARVLLVAAFQQVGLTWTFSIMLDHDRTPNVRPVTPHECRSASGGHMPKQFRCTGGLLAPPWTLTALDASTA